MVTTSLWQAQRDQALPIAGREPCQRLTESAVVRTSFIGRQLELATLEETCEFALSGRGGLVLMGGETGVGKSRLVAEFAARCELREVRVLHAAALEMLNGSVPYGLIFDLLLDAGMSPTVFSTLLPEAAAPTLDTGADPGLARMRLLGPLMQALLELSGAGPVVLVLEDLHWADPSSLDAVTWLINRLPGRPVLLLGTYRTTDVSPTHPLRRVLTQLNHHSIVTRIELHPFTRSELASLAEDLLGGGVDPGRVEEVYRRTQGNAFFAEELLMADPTSRLSSNVHDVLLSRLHLLTPEARRILEIVAVAGDDVSEQVIADVSQLLREQVHAALRALRDAYLVMPGSTGSRYKLRHSLLGEAVAEDLLDSERRGLHAAVADSLHRSVTGEPDDRRLVELAHHWFEADDPERALPATCDAAAALQRSCAFAEAYRQYERALDLSRRLHTSSTAMVPLLEEAAEAARWAGRTERAVDHLRAATALAGEEDAGRYERLGQVLWEMGQTASAQDAYARADALTAGQRGPIRARVLAEQARHRMLEGHFHDAQELCRQAVELAEDAGADSVLATATVTLGVSEALSGRVDDGLAKLREVRARAREGDSVDLLVRAFGNSAAVLCYLGRLDDSVEVTSDGLRLLGERGLDRAAGRGVLTNAAVALLWRGRWDEAELLIRDVLDRPLPSRHQPFLRLTLAEIAVARGDFAEAEEHLRYCRERAEELQENQLITPTLAAWAALHNWRGESDTARAVATEGLSRLPETEQEDYGVALSAIALRACADIMERNGSRRTSPELQREAEGFMTRAESFCAQLQERGGQLPECGATVAVARAELARLSGGDVVQHAREAAESWDELQRPFPAAYARWRQGQALLLRRRRMEAEPVLRSSLEVAAALGARPLQEAVIATLRAARLDVATPEAGHPGRRRPADRDGPEELPDELTGRELEVLRIAAQGRTNKEIGRALYISDRTVGIHLSHILDKLGARNRLEAVQVARRRGVL